MKAKQTLKQREKLKGGGVRRRKTPPPPSRTSSNGIAPQDAAQERAIGFSEGVAVTERFYQAMIEHKRGVREMRTHDIGCWFVPFEIDGVLEPMDDHAKRVMRRNMPRPSIWQRIKGWFA